MEKSKPHVFFSNRLECLADCLQEELFGQGSAFERRLILVPDARVKAYLYRYFAMQSSAKISFGMQVMSLSEGLQELMREQKKISSFYLPSQLDLSFSLEQKITALHTSRNEDPHFLPLWKYLGEKGSEISAPVRRKIISLSEQIARFFSLLGLQEEKVIQEWLSLKGWQQPLWTEIFNEDSIWSYPQKVLQDIPTSFSKIHLFGFSFIPKVYFDFFQKNCAHTYLLSPSEYFWEDLYSDKERVFLQKVLEGKKVRLKIREQMDLYLKESNPLLGNWGKMGKEFLKRLGETEPYIEEYYVQGERDSLLAKVQDDFLHLGEMKGLKESTLESDRSMQLHACTSRLREVEVLQETLMQLLQNSEKEGSLIHPSDILILSPNLSDYIPYIHQILGLSLLDYRIVDGIEKSKDDHIAAMEYLLSLPEKRFDLSSILELFSFTPFQQKHGFKQEDIYQLKKWFEGAGIEWGYNAEHRTSIVSKSVGDKSETYFTGTWEHGFERLLAGLILAPSDETSAEDFPFAWPHYGLEWNESELLGKAMALMTSLFEDLKEIDQLSMPFTEWSALFESLSKKYLADDEEKAFSLECQKLKGLLEGGVSSTFSLESFKRVFSFLSRKRKNSFQGSHLEALTFASLQVGSPTPSQVIFLLGMEEESFPRKEPSLPFCDFSALKNKTYLPSKPEEDRYLFLEAFLAARRHFFVSYCRVSSQDQKPQNVASVVEELFSYAKVHYEVNDSLTLSHPALSFGESYFTSEALFPSVYEATQKAAQSYYGGKKSDFAPFLPEFYGEDSVEKISSETETVSIKELTRFAKHPIKFFLQDVLGIYLPSLFQKEETEFILPAYERSLLRKEILKKPVEKVMGISRSKGDLPVGVFEDIAYKKMKEEAHSLSEKLVEWGLHKEEVMTLNFSDHCKVPSFRSGRWELPAITIKSPKGTLFKIEGTLSDVTSKGLLFHGENKIRDLVQVWPLYLIFLHVAKQIQSKAQSLYLTKKPEELFLTVEHPEAFLGKYLDYFLTCKSRASLLLPTWSEFILENDEKEFEKKMLAKDFIGTSPFPDDYLRWIFMRDQTPTLEGLHVQQKDIRREIFEPLLTRAKS